MLQVKGGFLSLHTSRNLQCSSSFFAKLSLAGQTVACNSSIVYKQVAYDFEFKKAASVAKA